MVLDAFLESGHKCMTIFLNDYNVGAIFIGVVNRELGAVSSKW